MYSYFTEKCHFQSDNQNPGLKDIKIKILFLGEDFSFLEMEYLIDMCSEEERLTFIHLPLASTQSKALQIATFSLSKKKKKKKIWNKTISSLAFYGTSQQCSNVAEQIEEIF